MKPSCVKCQLLNLAKPPHVISTGIGYLDHMLDQFSSHAQVGVSIEPIMILDAAGDAVHGKEEDANRNSKLNQSELLSTIGASVGVALRQLLNELDIPNDNDGISTTFFCPLDEALVQCVIQVPATSDAKGCLEVYDLAPYGKYPTKGGRTFIGQLETAAIIAFWESLAKSASIRLRICKIRGDNAHHIVESSFKAFCRALRNVLDGIHDGAEVPKLYDSSSDNAKASIALLRTGTIHRKTKETSIDIDLKLDGGTAGVLIDTGVTTLNMWFTQFATAAAMSLTIHCRGDLHIDEHHTAEDVAIAVGQALNEALGDKAGLNRMWWSTHNDMVQATVDLSNRPCLTHNLQLERMEFVGPDLSCEMFEHVLDSLTVNARMTVHLVQDVGTDQEANDQAYGAALVKSTAVALGQALEYCCMVDQRRAGATASSKGTLSV